MMAQEAALKEAANCKSRRCLVRKKLFNCSRLPCAGPLFGRARPDGVARRRFWTSMRLRSCSPKRSKVARYCARKKVGAQRVESVDCDPAFAQSKTRDEVPRGELYTEQMYRGSASEVTGEDMVTSTRSVQDSTSGSSLRMPVPASPPLSVQIPSSPSLSIQLLSQISSFDRNCAPSQAP